MDGFILTILTPEGEIFEGKTTSVIAPGTSGYFEVLAGHAHFVSTISQGMLKVTTAEETRHFAVAGGAAEVINSDVRLLLEACEPAAGEVEAKSRAKELAAG